jgi:hypothetical protein
MSERNPWVVSDETPTETTNPWVVPEEAPEVIDLADDEIVVELPTIPEDRLPEPTALEHFKAKTALFIPKDERTFKSCAHFVAQCKLAAKNLDKQYHAVVDPLNKLRTEASQEYKDPADAFLAMAKAVTIRMEQYAESVRLAAELEQKRLNDLAERQRREAEERETALRKAAEDARQQGDEKAAAKLEQKAETVAIKAAEIVPETVAMLSTKVDVGGATLSLGNGPAKKTWNLPGWDKSKPMKLTDKGTPDHRIAELLGDVSHLPPGVQFVLDNSDLNPVHLNKSYSAVKFPKPFGEEPDRGKSRLR